MCLVGLAVDVAKDYALVLAANRDERHARPTAPANWWPEPGAFLGGRDLVAGGTWLGIDRAGRCAALTNIHDPEGIAAPRSRGELVATFLRGSQPADEFGAGLVGVLDRYGAFSLLLYDGARLRYVSNRAAARELGTGIHVLSNAQPSVDWPKIRRARAGLADWLAKSVKVEALLDLLAERASGLATPDYYRESLFVEGAEYGTRSSTVLTIARTGAVVFIERRFDAAGHVTGEDRYDFELETVAGARRPLSAGDP
jgi:uncharacterized protein with NRDE domain